MVGNLAAISAPIPELTAASLLLRALRVGCGVPSLTFERGASLAVALIGRQGRKANQHFGRDLVPCHWGAVDSLLRAGGVSGRAFWG